MFERFTDEARRVVVLAQEIARTRRAGRIGTEHLLLGLLHPDTAVSQLLDRCGMTLYGTRRAVERRRPRRAG
ncbi:Clp protease N-terminal domain-containing protein [Pseudonocardia alni]|uniref:Clp protease N-terminal domain-containing protein n=1 Tax=Pseudonocardia alni TaxID=33907 RepID=UPI0036BD3561